MSRPWMLTDSFFTRALGTGRAKLSFSQFGEDMVLTHYLKKQEAHKFYIDVGCNDPHRFSNTYLLHHALGWRGMNIDLDPQCIERMKADRKGDVCVRAAVSDAERETEIVFFDDNAVNSITPQFIARQKELRSVDRTEKVRTRTLESLIDEHYPFPAIGLISIDVEGHDFEVLSSLDLEKRQPDFILIETGGLGKSDGRIADYLNGHGYQVISHMVISSLYGKA